MNEKIKYSTQQLSLASIKEAEFTEVEAQLKANISEAKEKSKKELEARESEFKIKIVQLEAEIHKQRDRYITVGCYRVHSFLRSQKITSDYSF